MLGAVVKYIGLSENEPYPGFIGNVGYVTSYTQKGNDGKSHAAVRWFRPLPVHHGSATAYSHFTLDERFEVLSESG
jgi:hypothetical protein